MKRWVRKAYYPSIVLIFLLLFSPKITECKPSSYFTVQVASLKKISNAEKEVARLKQEGYDAFFKETDIPGKGIWFRIYIGRFASKIQARAFSKELKAAKITDYTMIHEFEESIAIGVIDTARIITDSIAGKKARAEYLKILENKRTYFGSIQDKYLAKEDLFKKEEDQLSPEVKEERIKQLTEEKNELHRLKSKLEAELKETDDELKAVLKDEIKDVIGSFEEQENHLLLIEKNAAIVIDEAVDFTDKIIELYDAKQGISQSKP